MNARGQVIDLIVEGCQADEAVASLFHTVLYHRTFGKFTYADDKEAKYMVGAIGYADVDCDFIDLTYVMCNSNALHQTVSREISCFSEMLRSSESNRAGQITLEFFQRKQNRWYSLESIPWEVWTVSLELHTLRNPNDRTDAKLHLADMLSDRILYITELMNQDYYLPHMPDKKDLNLIFDTSYPDVQPYLFRIYYSVYGPSSTSSIGSTVKKLIKETLAF